MMVGTISGASGSRSSSARPGNLPRTRLKASGTPSSQGEHGRGGADLERAEVASIQCGSSR